MAVHIRRASLDDAESIAQNIKTANTVDEIRASLQFFQKHDLTHLVAEEDGRVVGNALLAPSRYYPSGQPQRGELSDFVIHADHQGTGLARQLVDCIADAARAQGMVQLETAAEEANEHAGAAYRALGFNEWGHLPNANDDGGMTFFYMTLSGERFVGDSGPASMGALQDPAPEVKMRDYLAWHDDYERPGSRLHLRLLVVQDLIAQALDGFPAGSIRLISMCAGQGRDIEGVARRHRRGGDLVGRLVELDRRNVIAARAAFRSLPAKLEVVDADASYSDAYVGATPADLVLVCGIFGNITDDDVRTTVEFLPSLCATGAQVIWTRGPRDDDILDRIRTWFDNAGFRTEPVVVGEGRLFGVGTARFEGRPRELERAVRLFEFFR